MSNFKLVTNYKGCHIELIAEPAFKVELRINGLLRESCSKADDGGQNPESGNWTTRLNSTVQTEYEWHEFIEAVVSYSKEQIDARIYANNTKIIFQTCPRIPE